MMTVNHLWEYLDRVIWRELSGSEKNDYIMTIISREFDPNSDATWHRAGLPIRLEYYRG